MRSQVRSGPDRKMTSGALYSTGWGFRSGVAGEDCVGRSSVQRCREALMMSKAELARKAGLSTLTVDRVEAGRPCRLDTKRKILLALGKRVSDRDEVFATGRVNSSSENSIAEEVAARA